MQYSLLYLAKSGFPLSDSGLRMRPNISLRTLLGLCGRTLALALGRRWSLAVQKARILELKRRYFKDYYSDNQYAVSIKEDTAYPCLHSPKTTKETRSIRRIQRRPIRRIGNIEDPLPSDDVVDLPLLEWLNENRTLIRKYSKIFLSIIGLSRSFIDNEIRPTFFGRDKKEMGLLDFVKSFDPFKVKTEERTLVENEISYKMLLVRGKRKVAFNAGLPPVKKAKGYSSIVPAVRSSTSGKTPTALEKLVVQSGQQDTGSGPTAAATKDFVSSPVTPTLEHEYEDEFGDNVRTHAAYDRYLVLTSSSDPVNTDASASLKTTSHIPYVKTEAEDTVAGPIHETGSSSTLGNEGETSSSTPSDASPSDVEFLDQLNVNSARHTCMLSELRLRFKIRLEKAEGEATKVGILRRRVSKLEATAAAKAKELAGLGVQNVELLGQVDSKLYPHMLTAVAGRRYSGRSRGRVEHGKVGREMGAFATYDPEVKARYKEAVRELENISDVLSVGVDTPYLFSGYGVLETRPIRSIPLRLSHKEEGWNRIKEYVQYQDDLWDDISPPMSVSSISKAMRPTFRGRLKKACNKISFLETPTREVGLKIPYLICDYYKGSHKANECKQTNPAEQVCLSGGDIYDDPSFLSKFIDELANFMLEKKSHVKGIGDILDQHRKELHKQFSQILSIIKKKTPKPKESTFAITTRSGVSTQDPPFPAPPRSTYDDLTEGETKKEGSEGAEPSTIQEPTPQPSIFYQPSKSSNLPFPSRLKKQEKNDEDERLLSIFKQIHINLPFLEAMIHMTKGDKVLKDLLFT
ncbi:hypothetical protein Tco_0706159 [Tanacetum coccineum]|uniref:Uncharacterized protein n=1 Tax=Tanacetum coccineum TaxID=301880 RepID=A0ABQ4Y6L1_9ASTR